MYAEGLARAEQFFLADEFVEGTRAHALGEGLQAGRGLRFGHAGEKAHGLSLGVFGGDFEFGLGVPVAGRIFVGRQDAGIEEGFLPARTPFGMMGVFFGCRAKAEVPVPQWLRT